MIDKETRPWLDDLKAVPEATMVIRLTHFPEDYLQNAKTRRERISLLGDYLSHLVIPIVIGVGLGRDSISVMGATGEAIVHGSPGQLRTLLEPEGVLAQADNLYVLPNRFMEGAGDKR